ncbi:hypothetical protein EDB86DRAFT_3077104 [Lactarius hatsudake]|nr:hypothetical protein EDB86DRAFT_3077104 [Lactarius hatsudake]
MSHHWDAPFNTSSRDAPKVFPGDLSWNMDLLVSSFIVGPLHDILSYTLPTMHGSRSDPPPAVISNRDQVRAISFLAIAIQLGAMVLIGYRSWKSIHWISEASECRLAALLIVVESDILYSITTTFLFGLSSSNFAAIFAVGLGLISKMAFFERSPEELSWFRELVDWNSSLKQEATEKYLLARNERTQISQPCFKRSTICPPRRTRGLNHIMKRSRTDWIKQDVASLQEFQSFFSVQQATTPSPLRFARRTANPVGLGTPPPAGDTQYVRGLRPILPVPAPYRANQLIGDGGKWVCGMERVAGQEECVVYSFRINGESSFEAALLERRQVIKCGGMTLPWTAFDPEIENTPNLKERGRKAHGPVDSPEYYTLDALMQLSGHTFIDRLKTDVEGAEFDTLTAFLAAHKPLSPFSSTTLLIGQLPRSGWPFWPKAILVYVNYNQEETKPGRALVYEYPWESSPRLQGSGRSR